MKNLREIDPTTAWEPYRPSSSHPWTNRLSAHLLRRAGFGGTVQEIVTTKESGPENAIDSLLDQTKDASLENEMGSAARLVTGGSDASQLASWWLLRMIKTPCPLLEKMTLFWHGHFATGADKVMDARAMLRQNQLIRKHALGKYEAFVKEMSSNVAMLIYLDSEENRKTRPNENYARELLELFCLGPGNYSEKDIKEIARCFTGWEIRRGKFHFNRHQHDQGIKSFLGAAGSYDGNDAVEVVLQQDAAPNFIARKLIRYFLFDDQVIPDDLVVPVAKKLRQSDFDIRSTMKMILGSKLFYSPACVAQKIKSPVELAVGFLRFFEASTNVTQLGQRLAELGQRPLYPPNVKGWAGGKSWINASTVLARSNLISDILKSGKTKFKAGSLQDWIRSNAEFTSTEPVEWAEEFLFATPFGAETRKSIFESAKTARDIKQSLAMLTAMPEFQLN